MACFRSDLLVVDPGYQRCSLGGFKYRYAYSRVFRGLCHDKLSGMGRFVAAVKKRNKPKVETFLELVVCLRFAREN
jgi:hypothetical protein